MNQTLFKSLLILTACIVMVLFSQIASGQEQKSANNAEFSSDLKSDTVKIHAGSVLKMSIASSAEEAAKQFEGDNSYLWEVDKDGYLTMPVIDKTYVEGLSISSATAMITILMRIVLKNPYILLDFNGLKDPFIFDTTGMFC